MWIAIERGDEEQRARGKTGVEEKSLWTERN